MAAPAVRYNVGQNAAVVYQPVAQVPPNPAGGNQAAPNPAGGNQENESFFDRLMACCRGHKTAIGLLLSALLGFLLAACIIIIAVVIFAKPSFDAEAFSLTLSPDVGMLNSSNFRSETGKAEIASVMFCDFAWVENCTAVDAPEFKKAAALLKPKGLNITWFVVNCETETKLCGNEILKAPSSKKVLTELLYGRSYVNPTVKLFYQDRIAHVHDGLFTGAEIARGVEFGHARLVSRVTKLTSENFDGKINNWNAVIVNFNAKSCRVCNITKKVFEEHEAFYRLKDFSKMNEFPLYLTDVNCDEQADLCSRFNIPEDPYIAYFLNGTLVTGKEGFVQFATAMPEVKAINNALKVDTRAHMVNATSDKSNMMTFILDKSINLEKEDATKQRSEEADIGKSEV